MKATVRIQEVYNITGLGPVPVGQVESGTLMIGMVASINGKTATVASIEQNHKQVQEASGGTNIGFNLKGVSKDDMQHVVGQAIEFNGSGIAHNPQNVPNRPKGFLSRLFSR